MLVLDSHSADIQLEINFNASREYNGNEGVEQKEARNVLYLAINVIKKDSPSTPAQEKYNNRKIINMIRIL